MVKLIDILYYLNEKMATFWRFKARIPDAEIVKPIW
jgi:hypothetical protein